MEEGWDDEVPPIASTEALLCLVPHPSSVPCVPLSSVTLEMMLLPRASLFLTNP